jgi:manganese efflux pump family protein
LISVSGIVLVAAALGLSNFAAAIGIGLSGVDGRVRIRVAIIFGFFEAAMPLLGLLVGHRVAGSIGSAASYLGGGLLIATGLYAFARARMGAAPEVAGRTNTGKLILAAAALSIDNLVVGFALGAHGVQLAEAVIVIAVVSVGMSLVGLEIGRRFSRSVEQWSAELGGAVLVLVGILIAAGVL